MGIWLLDENKGKVAKDVSGNDNHGEIQGAKWAKDKSSSALKFNGSTGRFVIPDSDSLYAKKSGPLPSRSTSINPKLVTDTSLAKGVVPELMYAFRTNNVDIAWDAYFRRDNSWKGAWKGKPRKALGCI